MGLSSTTKMTKTLALRAACTAAVTLSFPSRKSPLPSDTMSSSWAVSVGGGGGGGEEHRTRGRRSVYTGTTMALGVCLQVPVLWAAEGEQ